MPALPMGIIDISQPTVHVHMCMLSNIPVVEYPNCLHATSEFLLVQASPQTVPQVLLVQISRCPSLGVLPFTSRSWPSMQPAREC